MRKKSFTEKLIKYAKIGVLSIFVLLVTCTIPCSAIAEQTFTKGSKESISTSNPEQSPAMSLPGIGAGNNDAEGEEILEAITEAGADEGGTPATFMLLALLPAISFIAAVIGKAALSRRKGVD